MNDLQAFFERHDGAELHKWHHYFEIYERHLSRFRGRDVHVLEIGVFHGGSIQMWREYFGPQVHLYGADINPACKELERFGSTIFIGDQEDRSFLRRLREEIPRIDVLIDDGGHGMKQQIHTFEELFPAISDGGVYICEDTHTSYWPEYGGGVRRRGTFIEYTKRWIDKLHAWHSRNPAKLSVDEFTRNVKGVHFYDSVVVVEKGVRRQPTHERRGHKTVPQPPSRSRVPKQLRPLVAAALKLVRKLQV